MWTAETDRAQRDFLNLASAVPTERGGAQLEWHIDGWDIEIEFNEKGKITGILVAKEETAAPDSKE